MGEGPSEDMRLTGQVLTEEQHQAALAALSIKPLDEIKILLTAETLLPLICKMADHNDIVLTEDAWAAIDNETDVETLIGVAFLFSISNRTNVLVKGREEFIESGEYRKWFASNFTQYELR